MIHPATTKRNSTRSPVGNVGGDDSPEEAAPVCQMETNSAMTMNIRDLCHGGFEPVKDGQEGVDPTYHKVAVAGKERIIHGFQFVRPSLRLAF